MADMEISELLQGNIHSARNRQALRLSYSFNNCEACGVDGLGNTEYSVRCWVTASELGTILDIIEPTHNSVNKHLQRAS